jgi:hypothetical protein
MGERYQNVEKSSVGLRDVVPSRQLLMTRDITANENLPQILGYSDGRAPTPFILLASGTYKSSLPPTRGLVC